MHFARFHLAAALLIGGCLLSNTARPATGSAAVGQTAALSVTAAGSRPFTYQWYKDGAALAGATGRIYVILSVGTGDAGTYHAVVGNTAASITSDDAVLTVTPASDVSALTTQPDVQPLVAGDSVTFAVAPSGSGYQWQRQPAGSSAWENLADGNGYSGTATATLTVGAAAAGMSGDQFRCVVTGAGGSATSTAVTITVSTSTIFLQYPAGIARDGSGNLYVADAASNTIRKVDSAGAVSTLAGAPGTVGSQDAAGADARFNQPTGVAVDSAGNVYVADSGNATIRKITPGGGVTTLAGSPSGRGSADGAGSAALFSQPGGIAVDNAGTVYVTDALNATIRKITPNGTVSTLAGAAGSRGEADGPGPTARFNFPTGVAVDAAGNLYVADTYNATIRKIGPDGTVSTVAGSAGITGAVDLTGLNALFDQPFGVAVDAAGNVYVADTGNSTIRRIAPGGAVSTLAGIGGIAGLAEGAGDHALFNQPRGLVGDGAGNLYVADTGNAAIRRVTSDATVTTLALTSPPPRSPAPPSTPPPPPPPTSGTPTPPAGNGGGGGAFGGWFVAALLLLGAARWATRSGCRQA